MNYVENNGKKVAAVLCVASCFPVVATVYAMETEPGWHGDKYIKEDATVAKGWEEIEGKNYYFSEDDGSIEKETTKKAVVASVSSNISGDVQKTVANVAKEAVVEEVKKQEKEEVQAPVEEVVQTPVVEEQPTVSVDAPQVLAQDDTVVEEVPEVQQNTQTEELPSVEEVPSTPEVDVPAEDVENDVVEQTPAPEAQPEVQEPAPAPQPEVQEPAPAPQPEVQEPAPAPQPAPPVVDVPSNGDLGYRIAEAAKQLVGVTDGLWCTQVVQQALANAGVSDAAQLWPRLYADRYSGGVYSSTGEVGDLVFYNNGGDGVDHIAIYIGNGLAVHGNYWVNGESKTVIESVYNGGGGTPQFITVQR